MNNIRPAMRFVATATLLATTGFGAAQTLPQAPPPPPMPPQSVAVPEVVPPPEAVVDPDLETQVTITKKEGETVEEARVNGKLRWVKVTPRHGVPYYLVPDGADGVLIRRDGFDPGLRVPLWVLFSF